MNSRTSQFINDRLLLVKREDHRYELIDVPETAHRTVLSFEDIFEIERAARNDFDLEKIKLDRQMAEDDIPF